MSSTRRRLFQALTLLLILVTALGGLSSNEREVNSSSLDSGQPKTNILASYEERVFQMQVKLIVGILEFVKAQGKNLPSNAELSEQVRLGIEEALDQTLRARHEENAKSLFQESSESLILKEIIIASVFKLEGTLDLLCKGIPVDDTASLKSKDLIKRLCVKDPSLLSFSPEESKTLENELDWFGRLLVSEPDNKSVAEEAAKTFKSAFLGFGIASLVILLSIISLFVIGRRFSSKKTNMRFQQSAMPADYALEIFCLYLLSMFFLPRLIIHTPLRHHILLTNIVAIPLLTTLVFWPLFSGRRFREVRTSIGLQLFSLKKTLNDGLAGVFTYFAALIPMFIVMIIYSIFLTRFNVDVGQGAHPIVPILTETKNTATIFRIAFLAVVVAPIVEEIMFRGAFYTWLRARMNAKLSIVICAVIFAAIHPQGAVGIVPLSCIGIVLGFLREWRGNLWACMIAHACFNAGTLTLVLSLFR